MARHDVLNIEVDRTSHVEVEFDDGVTARFELAPLRLACPCAECNSRRQKDEPVSKSVWKVARSRSPAQNSPARGA